MQTAQQDETFLERLGITRPCALTLAAFLILCLGWQQALPAGETLIKTPLDYAIVLIALTPLACAFLVVREWRKQPRWRDFFGILLTLMLLMTAFWCFGYFKSLIPVFQPYYLDPWLQRIELWLHFGKTPYEWLSPFFTAPMIAALGAIYTAGWASAVFIYLFWQLFSPGLGVGRTLYLSTFTMTWLIAGSGLATLFSSVGPTFYSLYFHDQYSAAYDLMLTHLREVNTQWPILGYFEARDFVLNMVNTPPLTDTNGISAMPSLHTAMMYLLVLHSAHYHRRLLPIVLPLTILIFIGSFMLGWHYAIDTYVSVLVVWLIWRINRASMRSTGT